MVKANINQPSHSWMFEGRSGIGKATLAYRFIKYILSDENSGRNLEKLEVSPLDRIHKLIGNQIHPDLTVVESDTEISADLARKAISRLYKRPSISNFNVLLIDGAEKLNRSSANMLLKTLEEPPNHAVIILVCNSSNTLPKTIVSRCRRIAFSALSHEEIGKILKRIAPDMPENEIGNLAIISNGSVGDAAILYGLDKDAADKLALYRSMVKLFSEKASLSRICVEFFAREIDDAWFFVRIVFPRFFMLPCNYLIGLEPQLATNEEYVWLRNINPLTSVQTAVKAYSTAMSVLSDTEAFDLDKRASLLILLNILSEFNKALLI
ncbi:MAG: AAA family ATPase [Holosporales bacterium]|nr:AAA family ATPase [Holosporales bacterium]